MIRAWESFISLIVWMRSRLITDRVTVMRDGCYVGTLITKECTKDDIINMMVGRVIYEDPKTESNVPKNAPVVLKVETSTQEKWYRM